MNPNTGLITRLIGYLLIAPIHCLTITVLVATLFIPKQVNNYEEMKSLHLGYPFGFYEQNFSRYTPLIFPQKFRFGSPWEDPSRFHIPKLLLSYLLVYLLLLVFYRALRIFMHSLLAHRKD